MIHHLRTHKHFLAVLITTILLLSNVQWTWAAIDCQTQNRGKPTAGHDQAILFGNLQMVSLNPLRLATDPAGCKLKIVGVSKPRLGMATIENYLPDVPPGPPFRTYILYQHAGPMIPAVDSFDYTIANNRGETATGTITILLYPAYLRPPITAHYTIDAIVGHLTRINVVQNSQDPNGWLTGRPMFVIGTFGSNGTMGETYITRYQQDTVYYWPKKEGTTSFEYILYSEATGLIGRGIVTVHARLARPPLAPDYEVTIRPGQKAVVDVLSKAFDPEAAALPGWWENKQVWLKGIDKEKTGKVPGEVFWTHTSIEFVPNKKAVGTVIIYYRAQGGFFHFLSQSLSAE
jgi:hypothetical protein